MVPGQGTTRSSGRCRGLCFLLGRLRKERGLGCGVGRPQSLVWCERRGAPEGQTVVAPASPGWSLTVRILLHGVWSAPNGSTSQQTWARSWRSERKAWHSELAAAGHGVPSPLCRAFLRRDVLWLKLRPWQFCRCVNQEACPTCGQRISGSQRPAFTGPPERSGTFWGRSKRSSHIGLDSRFIRQFHFLINGI